MSEQTTSESHEGLTPTGVVRSAIYYRDDDGSPTDKNSATQCEIVEFDDQNEITHRTYGQCNSRLDEPAQNPPQVPPSPFLKSLFSYETKGTEEGKPCTPGHTETRDGCVAKEYDATADPPHRPSTLPSLETLHFQGDTDILVGEDGIPANGEFFAWGKKTSYDIIITVRDGKKVNRRESTPQERGEATKEPKPKKVPPSKAPPKVKKSPLPEDFFGPIDVTGKGDVEPHRSFRSHANKALKKTSPEQRKAIKHYTEDGFGDLTDAMMACAPDFNCLTPEQSEFMNAIEGAIAGAGKLPEPVAVFRGIYTGTEESEGKPMIDEINKCIEEGGDYQMPAITSTSLSPFVAWSFGNQLLFKIWAKSGLYLESVTQSPGEHELLLSAKKAKYKIHRAEKNEVKTRKGTTQVMVVYLEEID